MAAIIALCGCSSLTPEQRIAQATQSCESYGFQEGTTAFSQCMMQMDTLAQQRADYERAQLKANLNNLGSAMQRMSPPTPVTCSTNTTYSGGYTPYDRNIYSRANTTCQ
ncbi:hypothetical protein OF122_12925 [Pelagibacterium flavum]|uniref:Lipoprotein n=1 Tax=Pelagibacterium flavum TaxID=2984530 RepID=A0ABY6IKD0_9HYPH|nr:hypothetical protein [Pelagibacterium sp. YIM 151497]UYQ70961.1 hypothetical protein OF122_12925 [Pelagibacterium sp. YIM 151497]